MRSLEECRAEIFRRSEARLRARRSRRIRALALWIPLCLTAAVLPAVLIPSSPGGGIAASEPAPASEGPAQERPSLVMAEIWDRAGVWKDYRIITEPDETAAAYDAIRALYREADASAPGSDGEGDPAAREAEYCIRFTAEGGAEIRYALRGNALYDEAGAGIFLTAEQLDRLKSVLRLAG